MRVSLFGCASVVSSARLWLGLGPYLLHTITCKLHRVWLCETAVEWHVNACCILPQLGKGSSSECVTAAKGAALLLLLLFVECDDGVAVRAFAESVTV